MIDCPHWPTISSAASVDVIVTRGGTTATRAAKNATSTIPIVFEIGSDPVADGLVASLARPGGNLTGVSLLVVELMSKRVELLQELVPQAGAIALLVNPNNVNIERVIRDVQEAARAKGMRLHILKAGSQGEIDAAFAIPRSTPSRRRSSSRPTRSSIASARESLR